MTQPGSPHKQRASEATRHPVDDYRVGSVMRVKMVNFVTYADVEVRPGAKMNVVLGPNGSGKSTIVAALCLGLGGEPRDLDRKDSISTFVRMGCESAVIEVDICKKDGGVEFDKFSRKISATSGSSEWRFNGQRVDARVAKDHIARYHIQVGNLCQFLPQDKVVRFADLSPEELLKETEEAVSGKDELLKKHEELKKEQKTFEESGSGRANLVEELQTLRAKKQAVDAKLQEFQAREKLEAEMRIISIKIMRLGLEAKKSEARAAKEGFEANRKRREEYEASIEPLKNQVDAAAARSRQCKDAVQAAKSQIAAAKTERDNYERKFKDLYEQMERINMDLTQLKDRENSVMQGIAERKRKIAELKALQASAPAADTSRLPALKMKQSDLNGAALTAREELNRKQQEIDQKRRIVDRLRGDLQRTQSVQRQRLDSLQRVDPTCYEAYQHIQAMKMQNRFKQPVFGPVCIELAVDSQYHASVIEQQIRADVFYGFVTTNEDDDRAISELFMSAKFNGKRLSCFRVTGAYPHRHPVNVEQISSIGAICYLDEVVQAPPPVMQVLKDTAFLSSVLIGKESLALLENIDRLLRHGIQKFFTEKEEYQLTRSRYGPKEISHRTNLIRSPRILQNADGQKKASERVAEINARIQAEEAAIAALEKEIAAFAAEMEKINQSLVKVNAEIEEIQGRQTRQTQLKTRIETEEALLKKDMDRPPPAAQMAELKNQLLKKCRERLEVQKSFIAAAKQHVQRVEVADVADLRRLANDRQHIQLQREYNSKAFALGDLRAAEKAAEDSKNQLVSECKQLMRELDQEEKTANLSDAEKAEMDTLPSSLDQMKGIYAEKRARLQAGVPLEAMTYDQWRKEAKEFGDKIRRLEQRLEEEDSQIQTRRQRLEKLKMAWLTPLRDLVRRVNAKFDEHMDNLNMAGKVELVEAGDKFENYKLELQVRFRESEGFQVLSRQRQSGGERSVATMLYLLALQSEAPSPFRVVDEINQGVDQNNERKIFELMSNLSEMPNVPQYFMITPKLLPHLEFKESTCVLFVFNGPHSLSQSEWPDFFSV